MITRIQNLRFSSGEVIISVGFFLATDFDELKKILPKYVEDYEPLKTAFLHHKKQQKNIQTLICYNEAVAAQNGSRILRCRGTKSTITRPDGPFRPELSRTIKAVSMSSIIERVSSQFGDIDKLLINCEGAEIEIIKETSIELFSKCKSIFVQFHSFISDLEISKEEVIECIQILEERFDYSKIGPRKYMKYLFRRRK